MLVDVDAAVLENRRLSDSYSVLALDAPQIAAIVKPGQFVMLKPSRGTDPLLRRPFSVFEVLRNAAGAPTGISILNKRAGVGTTMLYDAEPGATIGCLGPLGRPFQPVPPPVEAWMVAGGVGLAPFATLAAALQALGTPTTLFYGARTADELYYVNLFEQLGVHTVLSTEDGSRGRHGRVTAPLADSLDALGPDASTGVHLYTCGPTPMMRAVARLAGEHRRRCYVSLEQVMGCGLGGCYSCVVPTRTNGGAPHFERSCIEGPVFDSTRIVWEALKH
ncbi:MAG: dihydroorotate dehydrogenase electron transfer subunit [Vicinamibacterales bacterium]